MFWTREQEREREKSAHTFDLKWRIITHQEFISFIFFRGFHTISKWTIKFNSITLFDEEKEEEGGEKKELKLKTEASNGNRRKQGVNGSKQPNSKIEKIW